MPIVIEIVMMSVAAIMLLVTQVNVDEVPKTADAARRGRGGDRHLRAGLARRQLHRRAPDVIVPAIGDWAKAAPWTFAFGLFFASVLLYSQAATTRALMPLGMALGIPPQFLIAMFPSVNGYFFIPTYGSLIAAINFDLAGHDEDRQVRAQPLVHDPGHRRDLRRGDHGPRDRARDLLTRNRPGLGLRG